MSTGKDNTSFASELLKMDVGKVKDELLRHKEALLNLSTFKEGGMKGGLIHEGADELVSHTRGYGVHNTKPADYLHDFAAFEAAYNAKDRSQAQDERWQCFTREEIAQKGNSLDLGLINDDSVLAYKDLPDPAESAAEAADKLAEAVDLLQSVAQELKSLQK